MFLFKRKETGLKKPDYGSLGTDMHSHLLPGIDDGSPDMETSIELIREMKELGFRKLITTPHVFWDLYKNTRPIILDKLAELKDRLRQEEIEIEIEAAAEYFVDEHLQELLSNKDPLLTFGNRMVLVEFSMASRPFEMKKIFFEMQLQGYQPVLAHPERYSYLEYNKNFYDELKDAGYFFQMNLLSLCGFYGNSALHLARYLVKKNYYDLVGTDLHHFAHLEALKNPSHISTFQKMFESERILNRNL